jgi:Ca-activated chloride channel family protein
MTQILAAAVAMVFQVAALAQPASRFRSATELVSVDVLVTEGRQPVLGLAAADFELLDNGVRQSIEQLYVERLQVNVVMVLDTSGSVRGERLQSLKAGALSIVERLRPADRAAVISFSHRLTMPAPLTSDRTVLRKAIAGLTADGSTALRDAAYAGLALGGAAATRTLVLLFSDGLDTGSLLAESRVIAIARRSDAIVYAIGVREPAFMAVKGAVPGQTAVADDRFLTLLARETGGRLLHAQEHRDIETTFSRVLEEFNSRYVLGYTPRGVAPGGWHKVDVRLKNKRGTVLARRGYFAGS